MVGRTRLDRDLVAERQLVLGRGRQEARRPAALMLALLEPGRAGSASVAASSRILVGGRWGSRVVVALQAGVCGGGQDDQQQQANEEGGCSAPHGGERRDFVVG